jgi:hypothetical protein
VLSQAPELPQLPTSQVTVVPPLVSIVTTSEAKAQNKSYNLIDYAWYFRFSDGLAYVRVNNINSSSYTALDVDNNKVYSIKKIGTKVQWLIDNVVVHGQHQEQYMRNYLYCLLLHMPNHRKI